MDPLTRKLVQTVRQITENKNTGVPVLGNVNPVTGQREPGVHEYDHRTGEKTKSHSEKAQKQTADLLKAVEGRTD